LRRAVLRAVIGRMMLPGASLFDRPCAELGHGIADGHTRACGRKLASQDFADRVVGQAREVWRGR
jgi:hypothetical protein